MGPLDALGGAVCKVDEVRSLEHPDDQGKDG